MSRHHAIALLTLLTLTGSPVVAADILFVQAFASTSTSEDDRINTLTGLGHNVTTIVGSVSEAELLNAASSVDVVYVPSSVLLPNNRIRRIPVGVFNEQRFAVDALGFSTTFSDLSSNTLTALDTSHPIMAGLSSSTSVLFTTSNADVSRLSGTIGTSVRELAQWNGQSHAISTLEMGDTLVNSNDGIPVALARRVMIPLRIGFQWTNLTADGLAIIDNSIDWLAQNPGNGQKLLLVTDVAALTDQEAARLADFVRWGYTVTMITDSDTQANFDAAVAAVNVAYVSEEVDSGSLGTKLREAPIGVVFEERASTDDFGLSTSFFNFTFDATELQIVNNTHPISSPYAIGTQITFNTSPSAGAALLGTLSPDLQILGIWPLGVSLAALEQGATLVNTINGNSTASGRRVAMLVGDLYDWNLLAPGGETIIQRSLSWASGTSGSSSTGSSFHWPVDETSGATVTDSSPDGADGTLIGGTRTADGVIGGAITLTQDASDRIELPPEVLDGASDVSFAAWFRATNTAGLVTLLSGANASNSNELLIGIRDDDRFVVSDGEANVTAQHSFSAGQSLIDGRWHHVAVVRDATNNQITLYLDGASLGTQSATLNTLNIEGLILGEEQDSVGGSFNVDQSFGGSLDEIYLFREAISAARVAELYGLIGHWRLDETTGSVAADSSLVNNDAHRTRDATPDVEGPYPGAGNATQYDGGFDLTIASGDPVYDQLTEQVSVAVWTRFDTAPAGQTTQHILVSNENFASHLGYALIVDQPFANEVIFRIHDGSTHHDAVWNTPDIMADEWVHLVGIYDGTEVKLYANGQLVASTPFVGAIAPHASGDVVMGVGVEGRLQDVRLYNRGISHREVAELYGLIAHYRLDETSGLVATDSSGSGYHADYIGAPTLGASTASNAPPGSAVTLDGASQYIDSGRPLLNNLEGFAIAGWVHPSTVNPSLSLFGQNDVVEIGVDISPIQLNCSTGGGGFLHVNNQLAANAWTHVALVGDGSQLLLYINGNQVASGGTTTNNYGANGDNFKIGEGVLDPTGDFFEGSVDDIRVYNRPISPEEARGLYYDHFTPGPRIVRWVEVANP